MKLLKVLSVAALGTLFAVGCTVTTTDSAGDGGTTVTDSGAKTDSGSTKTDSGSTATDSGSSATDSGDACETCQVNATSAGGKCEAEAKACSASADASAGCKALFDCINACADNACANKCVSDSTSAEGKAILNCLISECSTACGG